MGEHESVGGDNVDHTDPRLTGDRQLLTLDPNIKTRCQSVARQHREILLKGSHSKESL